jgi:hypothetical protein
MYIGSWKLGDTVTFVCNGHLGTTGAASDADSVPTYRVYEDITAGPLLTGSMALLDGSNTTGLYAGQAVASVGNGFEQGKTYTVYIEAVIGGITATISRQFQIGASVSLVWILGTLLTETAGQIAAGFKKLLDVAVPVFTLGSVNQTGDNFPKTTNLPAAPAAGGSAMTLTSGERNSTADAIAVRADTVETGYSFQAAFRLMLASLAGKVSGAGTSNVLMRDVNDTKNRINATVTAEGNRTVVTKDVS